MVEEILAYDLRQKYAEIVGAHLERVSNARFEKNYPAYFQALEDLFTVIKHKFKKKKVSDNEEEYLETTKKKKKEIKKTDLERYYELRKVSIELSNKHKLVYLGQTHVPEEVAKLETAFRDVEMFLFYVMDNSKMFGSAGYNEGL